MYGMKGAGSNQEYKDLNSLATVASKGLRKRHGTENDVCLPQKLENCGYWKLVGSVEGLGKGGKRESGSHHPEKGGTRQRNQKSRDGKGRKLGAVMEA